MDANQKKQMIKTTEKIKGLIRMLDDKIDEMARVEWHGDLNRIHTLLLNEIAGDDEAAQSRVDAEAPGYYTMIHNGKRIRITIPE